MDPRQRILVAHVINRLSWFGGAESQLMSNLQSFEDTTLDHTVIALFGDTRQNEFGSARRFGVISLFEEGSHPGRIQILRELYRALSRLRPDLIHCSLADAALASRLAGPHLRIPVLESLVNISHDAVRVVDNENVSLIKLAVHRFLDRVTMRRVSHFHALTAAVANSWIDNVGIDSQKVSVIPRGLDLGRFDDVAPDRVRRQVRDELGLASDSHFILSVGREEPQKGHRYLLEAMPQVLREFPESHLIMVGRKGNSTPDLEHRISELGLASRVQRLGVRNDVPRLLMATDVFAFPSLFEGLGVALLEAMAARAACVAADIPPFSGIVENEVSALLVPPRDSTSLADAIVRLLVDKRLRLSLGHAARETVQGRFDIRDIAPQIETLYRSLTDQHVFE